jgi:hypothetical protein
VKRVRLVGEKQKKRSAEAEAEAEGEVSGRKTNVQEGSRRRGEIRCKVLEGGGGNPMGGPTADGRIEERKEKEGRKQKDTKRLGSCGFKKKPLNEATVPQYGFAFFSQ